jgi:hypothetical protein
MKNSSGKWGGISREDNFIEEVETDIEERSVKKNRRERGKKIAMKENENWR